jgi:hypothetical protein
MDPGTEWSLPEAFSGVEVDSGTYLSLAPRSRIRFRRRIESEGVGLVLRTVFRSLCDPIELSERLKVLEGDLGECLLFHLFSSGRKCWDPLRDRESLPALDAAFREAVREIHFEWGQDDDLSSFRGWSLRFPLSKAVIDPAVHQARGRLPSGVGHFRLHGWHSERWVRRYGEKQARDQVARILKSEKPGVLILAHSGRIEEGGVFSEAIRALRR